jgi:hypothetical protein
LTEVRKGRKVTTPDPEASFEALKKYARDLTPTRRRASSIP